MPFKKFLSPLLSIVALSAVTLWLLGADGADYLRKVEHLSLWVPTHDYFEACLTRPGGILAWCATALTTTFFHPWMGAAVYALLLVFIALATIAALRIPSRLASLTLLVPSAALLAFLNLGYLIYSLKTPGVAFLLPLGVLVAMLMFWGFRAIKMPWLRHVAALVGVAAGYCLMGFYGLLFGAMCIAFELPSVFRKQSENRWTSLGGVVAIAAVAAFVPTIWFGAIGGDLRMADIHTVQLPWLYEGESAYLWPYIAAFAVLLLFAGFAARRGRKSSESQIQSTQSKVQSPKSKVQSPNTKAQGSKSKVQGSKSKVKNLPEIAAALAGILALAAAVALRYDDPNFKLSVAIDNALWDEDWDRVLELRANNLELEPTRLNVILTDMALLRKGEATAKMFRFPQGSADFATTRALRATHDAGAMQFCYHTGFINYAYRWAMENLVEYGMSVERLKMMVKCALLNGEVPLARKSLETLKLTPFHREWAERYAVYADHPEKMADDAEFASITPVITQQDQFFSDGGQLEGFIWAKLAQIERGNIESLELSMIGALVSFNIDAFADRITYYANHTKHLPLHFQEALLLWSNVNENEFYRQFNLDQQVIDRFDRFMHAAEQYSTMPEEQQAKMMRAAYGDTYWYYCYYQSGSLKVI